MGRNIYREKFKNFLNADKKVRKQIIKDYNHQERQFFAADFECTTTEPFKVYIATVEDLLTGDSYKFYSIDDFIEFFSDKKDATVWFHNGSNYDNYFIIPYALKRHGTMKLRDSDKLILKIKQPFVEVDARSGEIKFDKKTNNYKYVFNTVRFCDSRKIIQGSLEKIAPTVGLQKGGSKHIETPLIAYINSDTDWAIMNKDSSISKQSRSFKEAMQTEGWEEYAVLDTHILAEAIKRYGLIDDARKNIYSASRKAWNELVSNCPEYEAHLKSLKQRYKQTKMVTLPNGKKVSRTTDIYKYYVSEQKAAQKAYKGGVAWTNPMYANQLIECEGKGFYLDFTSLYPSIYMNSNEHPLPYTMPSKGNRKTDLYIIHLKNLKMICKPGKFPLIKNRTDVKTHNSKGYYAKFTGDISLTSVEWDYVVENYEILNSDDDPYSYEVIYYERHYTLEKALRQHGEKWYKVKETATDEVERGTSKLYLNGCYGYLGFFQSERALYEYVLEEDEDRGQKALVKQLKEDKAHVGLSHVEMPAAAFITAYGRVKLAIYKNTIGLEHVAQSDTDSLIVVGMTLDEIREKIVVTTEEDQKLGYLKIEHTFDKCRCIKAKTYCIANNKTREELIAEGSSETNIIKQACAGSNHKFKYFEEFVKGAKMRSKERVFGVGGVGIMNCVKVLGGNPENDYLEDDYIAPNAASYEPININELEEE